MQFRLQTLLLVFVVLWSSLALFGVAGIAVFLIVLVMAAVLNGQTPNFVCLIVPVLVLAMLGVLLAPAVREARDAARRLNCNGHLCQISFALLNYEQAYHCFPPAYISDKNGKPMHSWRVLILPFIEEQTLYKQYNFNEPWDGPNNKKLLAQRPSIFACPSDETSLQDGVTTNYIAVVGNNALWRPGKPRSLAELAKHDQAKTTVMLVETADSGINWTEPRDFCLDEPKTNGLSTLPVRISSRHSSNGFFFHDASAGAWVNFVEWRREFLPAAAAESDKLDDWLAVGGYKQEEIDSLSKSGVQTINWTNCAALVVWIASVGLLFYRARRSRKVRESHAETGNSTGSC